MTITIVATLDAALLRRFSFPVELRTIIAQFLYCKLSNQTILHAVDNYHCSPHVRATYGKIEWWDTSEVTNMRGLFWGKHSFNENISRWDVSNVESMSLMFAFAKEFNQPLDNWDVSRVKDMEMMFLFASRFNQSFNQWKFPTTNKVFMMLQGAKSFQQPLAGKWKQNESVLGIVKQNKVDWFWLVSLGIIIAYIIFLSS